MIIPHQIMDIDPWATSDPEPVTFMEELQLKREWFINDRAYPPSVIYIDQKRMGRLEQEIEDELNIKIKSGTIEYLGCKIFEVVSDDHLEMW